MEKMTVGQLRAELEGYDEDVEVLLKSRPNGTPSPSVQNHLVIGVEMEVTKGEADADNPIITVYIIAGGPAE